MDDSNVEFISCPWCGNEPELINSKKCGFSYVCGNPDSDHYVETGWCKTEAEARAIWNKRKC